jgi:hypothetical protein
MASHIGRRKFLATLGGAAAAWPLAVRAQQQTMPVVGYLYAGSSAAIAHLTPGFREGLNDTSVGMIQNYEHARNEPNITRLYEPKRGRQPPCGIHLPAQSATDSVPAGRANRQAGADTQCRRLSVVGWSRPICFSFNAGQWVARPVCPAAQAANFGLVDPRLTEADRRPFKLPLQLGELPIEPAEERLSSLRVASIAALRRRSSSSNRE